MIAVIMAGGKGTRLESLTNNEIPKSMYKFVGKPIIEHQIEYLKNNGIKEVIIIIGYLGNKIKEHLENGDKFGVEISYIEEEQPLGTAGGLYYLKNIIKSDFLLIYGDIIFNFDIKRMYEFHLKKASFATLFVHPNSHPYDSDLIIIDDNNQILNIDLKNSDRSGYWYKNLVNAGIYIFSPYIIRYIPEGIKSDLEKDIIVKVLKKENIYAYISTEYVKDIGTPKRIFLAEKDFNDGLIDKLNLKNKQKAVFIDRDGTLNVYKGLINNIDDFELFDFTSTSIIKMHQLGYLVFVITNQPVVARGLCDLETVEKIHSKLETLLGKDGAFIDGIKYCPHHPDKGYKGENLEFKISCNCRKPKLGLLSDFIKNYNIDLQKSWFIGDTTTDIKTGNNAQIKTILVLTGEAGNDGKFDVIPDFICSNILEATDIIGSNKYEISK